MLDQVLSRGSAPLATGLKWLIIAGIAYTVATTVLFFIPGAGTDTQPIAPITNTDSAPKVDARAIAARHLFGHASEQPRTQQPQAVETRLPLVLKAVFQAPEEPEASSAVIAQKGQNGNLYKIGETVPGNAELLEVYESYVILRRAGTRERLNFPKAGGGFIADQPEQTAHDNVPEYSGTVSAPARSQSIRQPNPAPAPTQTSGSQVREAVASYQQKLTDDPEGALDELGIEALDDGGGYRLGNVAASPYLSQTGLQSGDIILSVNGQPVGDVDSDRMELANVLAQGTARIEVQRGTRRFYVTTSLQ